MTLWAIFEQKFLGLSETHAYPKPANIPPSNFQSLNSQQISYGK